MSSTTNRLRLSVCLAAVILAAALPAGAQSVTVDNSDPEFSVLYGTWNSGAYGNPYGSDYNWALTTAAGGSPAAVEWRPDLPQAGGYLVEIWYVEGTNRASDAVFTVHHAAGSTDVVVNQQVNGETWVSLGSFAFDAGTSGYVTLDNAAGPSVVIADAVRFTPTTTTVQLTMAVSPSGWGQTSPAAGSHTYYLGETVPIQAVANGGYQFHHWTVSGGAPVADPASASTTVLMGQDKTVTAVFVEQTPLPVQFRGFWADAFHEGFKSAAEIDAMIARALEGNYNAILPEVLAFQDTGAGGHGAYWDSAIVPRASDISGGSGFDPLAYLVQQAHANGLEVHPWLVTYRVSSSWPPAGNATLSAHPEWLMVSSGDMGGGPATINGYYTLDPGSPDVQEYLISIVRELVSNYDIDGIHWDYIRYTTTDAGYPAYTWYARSGLARFQQISGYGGTPAVDYAPWEDFRRREITELIRRAQVEMATIDNPRQPLRHTAALITWGDAPSNFQDTNSWRLFQNWRLWMEEGYLDAGIPMTYYDYDTYPSWYENWVNQELVWRYDRHIFVGPGIYLNDFVDSVYEINYALNAGADGVCTYSYASTSPAGSDWSWYAYVAANVFTQPAQTPPMPWRDPNLATEGVVYGRVTDGTTGAPIDDATVRVNGFDVAYTDGNGFFAVTHLPAAAGGTQIPMSVVAPGYAEVARPSVLIEPAGYTQANFALGLWLPGDYDVDGDVDISDFEQFVAALTGPEAGPPPAGGDIFDFEPDDDVDMSDLAVFQAAFTGN